MINPGKNKQSGSNSASKTLLGKKIHLGKVLEIFRGRSTQAAASSVNADEAPTTDEPPSLQAEREPPPVQVETEEEKQRAAIARLLPLLYGDAIPDNTIDYLRAANVCDIGNPHVLMRRIIGALDRQRLSTPITVRFGPEDLVFEDFGAFSLAIDLADQSVGVPIRRDRSYEPHVTAFLQHYLQPDMNVIDVGANIGYFTLLAAKTVGERGTVFSFEPNSENARLILIDIEKNAARNIRLFPVALSNETGNAFFWTHLGSNGGFLPTDFELLQSPNCTVVPTFKLDQLIEDSIHLIKMDVEGAEGLVVEGASRLIQQHKPIIISEFSPEMLQRVSRISPRDYLQRYLDWGYQPYWLDRTVVDPGGLPIENIDEFLCHFSDVCRIEDLAFIHQPRVQG